MVPQQLHHLSGSPSPNVVAISGGAPIGKLVHHTQLPGNVNQMGRRPLLLQVSFESDIDGMSRVRRTPQENVQNYENGRFGAACNPS